MAPQSDVELDLARYLARRGSALLRFALGVTVGDRARAEDLVQSALVAVWSRSRRAAPPDDLDAYVRRAVVNANLSHWRRRPSFERVLADLPERPGPDAVGRVDDVDAVWRLLRTLPRRQQTALALRYAEDLTDHEIAQLLGCAEATVRSLCARGLQRLRDTHPARSEMTS